jgi:PAS domain S-box-containing protein
MINFRGKQIRVAALRDITERKRAKEALRASEESYRRLFDGSRDGIYITALDGSLEEANQSLLDIFGFTREEFNSINVLASYFDPDARKRFQRQIEREGSVKDYEIKLLRKDGTVADCLITTSLRRSEKGTIDGYHGILRDVTEQKRLQHRLYQAHKMEAIGTLAGGIAHDFNNILYGIIGFTELALDDDSEKDKTKEYLQRVLSAGERAKYLVKQILTFSRHTEQEKKPILVAPIVKEVCKFLRASLPTTIAINQDIEQRLGSILGDPTQIHQVLMNLCTNAGHAMRKTGGDLFVGLHEMVLDSTGIAAYPGVPAGTYQRLVVRDTGTGIEPPVRERMFEPYFSTKEKGEGTGLGLAVVHGIVQGHKGFISVRSEPTEGTVFTIFFPVVEKQHTVKKYTGTVPLSGTERILLVDDEEIIVEIVKAMVESLGYTAITTNSSLQALELFRADPYGFDLVITDMTMPNMTGKDLAEKMITVRRDIPIILCTGFTELITEEQAKSIGIRELVMKPVGKNDMAQTIRRVLDA